MGGAPTAARHTLFVFFATSGFWHTRNLPEIGIRRSL